MHLHNGRVIGGDRRRIAHSNILDIGATEQDVVVDLVLRRDGELCFPILRAKRSHCLGKRERGGGGRLALIIESFVAINQCVVFIIITTIAVIEKGWYGCKGSLDWEKWWSAKWKFKLLRTQELEFKATRFVLLLIGDCYQQSPSRI